MKRNSRSFKIAIIWIAIILVLNLMALCIGGFSDWYIRSIFPIWINTYGRFMGIFPFSVGEILFYLGVALALAAIAALFYAGIRKLIGVCRKAKAQEQAKKGFWMKLDRWNGRYLKCAFWLFLGVCTIMTLNCSILYRATPIEAKNYMNLSSEYTLEQLLWVRNYVLDKCNTLAEQMPRDEEGNLLYEGDLKQEAIRNMQSLGETYSQVAGYYPKVKPLATSDFFTQQYICGYFFPFSMEANYNTVMNLSYHPSTFCHELAHLKGYIYEEEASFISFAACVQSSDPFFQYSGYLSVYTYLNNDLVEGLVSKYGDEGAAYYKTLPRMSAKVRQDKIFVSEKQWERINEKAVISTEVVDKVSDKLTDTSLKAFGIEDGILSYGRVVGLVLRYYDHAGMLP